MQEQHAINAQAQRWIWFLDVVFGAIVALGLERYEPVLGEVWALGFGATAVSVVVALSIFSFVIYDIIVYHALATKFPYQLTKLGFGRFYLDVVMAFMLYALLAQALRVDPNWVTLLAIVSAWHAAALIWHLAARREHGVTGGLRAAVAPHAVFVAVYWVVAGSAWAIAQAAGPMRESVALQTALVAASLTILGVSLYRWQQVLLRVVAPATPA